MCVWALEVGALDAAGEAVEAEEAGGADGEVVAGRSRRGGVGL